MIEQLSPHLLLAEEADTLAINAFFGSLEDLYTEFTGQQEHRRQDDEIMAAVAGVFDTASSYYSESVNQQLQLMDALAVRLADMACQHDHFNETLERFSQQTSDLPNNGQNHDHQGHIHPNKEDINEKREKKKKKELPKGWLSALLTRKLPPPKRGFLSPVK